MATHGPFRSRRARPSSWLGGALLMLLAACGGGGAVAEPDSGIDASPEDTAAPHDATRPGDTVARGEEGTPTPEDTWSEARDIATETSAGDASPPGDGGPSDGEGDDAGDTTAPGDAADAVGDANGGDAPDDTAAPDADGDANGGDAPDDTGAPAELAPPPGLVRWWVGDPSDAEVTPLGPGLVLMGGGPDVDDAFRWARDRASGGDAIVLRASGADGYNSYLYDEIGGFDSVETLRVDTRALADHPWVAQRVADAELVFIAGGDQAVYDAQWRGTAMAAALETAWARGAILGGTSAGLAILGGFVYTAENGTVYSDEALEDPYAWWVTLAPALVSLPALAGVVTDSHFRERDRMGRLVAFVARLIADGLASLPLGLGIDEATALVVDQEGEGVVLGSGAVYLVRPGGPPELCKPGEHLAFRDLELTRLAPGDAVTLPAGTSAVTATPLSAEGGVTSPADPY